MERLLLRQLREELLSDEAFEVLVAEVRRLLAESKPDPKPIERELAKVRKESENIMAAIRHSKPRQVIPQLRRCWEELVETFGQDETPEDMRKGTKRTRGPHMARLRFFLMKTVTCWRESKRATFRWPSMKRHW